jgi:UDP-N-acetylmuramoyl-L-alanyl-D-glutamate--2,6-diaminopimelate ligase
MDLIRKVKNIGHFVLAIVANLFYGFPSRNLTVIGVTGTDGKTTTCALLYEMLVQGDKKVALISTLGAVINGKKYQTGFHVTTPSPFGIQKYLRQAVREKCEFAIIEVTSHALDQKRVWGINFELGLLTNITREHLDYHKTYIRYCLAKITLLKSAKKAIVNSNGEWFPVILKYINKARLVTYSLNGEYESDVTMRSIGFELRTNLVGDFNKENILAAYLAAKELGIKDESIDFAIRNFHTVEGRQEEIVGHIARILVDFAHTPNSFKNLLPVIKKQTSGRLIHVFGAAGERDSSKRSTMGMIASEFDDVIILTAEDPRGERIEDINEDIRQGIDNRFIQGKNLFIIEDRKKAIAHALQMADVADTVLITGKGHEKSMNYGQGEVDWSDQKVTRSLLKSA